MQELCVSSKRMFPAEASERLIIQPANTKVSHAAENTLHYFALFVLEI